MTAVQNGAYSIMAGVNEIVLAGGTESMTNAITTSATPAGAWAPATPSWWMP